MKNNRDRKRNKWFNSCNMQRKDSRISMWSRKDRDRFYTNNKLGKSKIRDSWYTMIIYRLRGNCNRNRSYCSKHKQNTNSSWRK